LIWGGDEGQYVGRMTKDVMDGVGLYRGAVNKHGQYETEKVNDQETEARVRKFSEGGRG
jgi:hypothetical protein